MIPPARGLSPRHPHLGGRSRRGLFGSLSLNFICNLLLVGAANGEGGAHEGFARRFAKRFAESNFLRRRLVVRPVGNRFAGGVAANGSDRSGVSHHRRRLGNISGAVILDGHADVRDPNMAHCHRRLDRRLLSASWLGPRSIGNRRSDNSMKSKTERPAIIPLPASSCRHSGK